MLLTSRSTTAATETTAETARPKVDCLDKESQTTVEYPTVTEIIKEVEVVREVRVTEDPDKINDTNITRDEKGHYHIFEQTSNLDELES